MTFSGKFRQKYADGPFSTSSHQPELIFLIPSPEIAASQPRNGCWRDPIDVCPRDQINATRPSPVLLGCYIATLTIYWDLISYFPDYLAHWFQTYRSMFKGKFP
ncbi:hypothetical protein B0I72DRAFT_173937 [Yarrowia lipolytica]|nr:hypothetical protein B0I72DRAFT_173937 [Yarrowia lipolytica]